MKFPISKGKGRRGKFPRKFKAKRATKVSLAVKKYVARTLHTQIENKSQQYGLSGIPFGSILGTPALNVTPITPYAGYLAMTQGTTQNARVGNTIRPRKVMFNYVLYPSAYSATTNNLLTPCEVMFWLCSVKQHKGVLPTTTDIASFFQNGSTSSPPTGLLVDLISPINTDVWTVHKSWTHKVGNAIYNGSGGIQGVNEYFANNDFKLNIVRKHNVTKYVPKVIHFEDGTSSSQSNGLFVMYQCISAAGATIASGQTPMTISYEIIFDYEDA